MKKAIKSFFPWEFETIIKEIDKYLKRQMKSLMQIAKNVI
jgi:hypothetical protein